LIRWGGAAFMGLAPIAVIACLLALGRQGFDLCFNQKALSFWASVAAEAPGLLHPIGFVGLVPFLALATVWANRSNQGFTFGIWLALLGLAVVMLWPPASMHDCDRKGSNGIFIVLMLVLPGIFANWLAVWKSNPKGPSNDQPA
jgi:hypothetical protein